MLFVTDTLISDIETTGVWIQPTGSGHITAILDRIESDNNFQGVIVAGESSTGKLDVIVANSVISNADNSGVTSSSQAGHSPTSVMVRNSVVSNSNRALSVGVGATLRVTRSTITGNGVGFEPIGGMLLSYGDNNLDGNTTDGTPTNTLTLH
jgi:hypothetical protein